jgi:hypothetical protein
VVVAVEGGTNQLTVGERFRVNSAAYCGGIHGIFHGLGSCGLHTSLSALVHSGVATDTVVRQVLVCVDPRFSGVNLAIP